MSDEDALLNAIAAHPDEDTPRLVYADWLDEHDRPVRAEFIRVQIEIARLETLPRAELNRHVAVFKRNQELIDTHSAELLGPLAVFPAGHPFIEFRRGFVWCLEAPVDVFLGFAPLVASLRPLPRVRVSEAGRHLTDFIRCPDLGVVTELLAFGLFATSHPTRPTESEISEGVGRLTRLAVLDLERCWLGDEFCERLGTFDLPALTTLNLSQNALTDVGVDNLLRTHHPRRLKRLVLGGNEITDAGALALARDWPTGDGDKLEVLNLQFTNIGATGQAALLNRFGGRVDLF